MSQSVHLTGVERFFDKSEIIVSKTNLTGHITYANRTFLKIAGYEEKEIMGQPHSIIRHPDMPRCVFKYLWDTLEARKEIFAFVVNRAKCGDHYWVFAHVTPSYDETGKVTGYHSSRRVPDRKIVGETIIPLYKQLLEEEDRHSNRKEGMNKALGMLVDLLQSKGITYDELIFSLLAAA